MEAAELRLANLPVVRVSHISDHDGLHRAYANVNKVMYMPSNGKMYIAGTQTFTDIAQWRYIPLHQIQNSTMYKRADRIAAINNAAGIDHFIGHSMGALVAKALGEKYNKPYVMYGAPEVTMYNYSYNGPNARPIRTRAVSNYGDVVSSFDFNAEHQVPRNYFNPHEY